MSKYRLKKDLPFAKAGAEVFLDKDVTGNPIDNRISVEAEKNFGGYKYFHIGYSADLQKLINEGWIEEVKPREYDIHINKKDIGVWDCANNNWLWRPTKEPTNEPLEIIKVREVL